jgi:riboflavin synthase alpha subunit
MFTGIVATTGKITQLQPLENGGCLTVEVPGLNL